MSLVKIYIYIHISMIMGGRVDDPRLLWRELAYPTLGKGKPCSRVPSEKGMLVSRMVPIPRFSSDH